MTSAAGKWHQGKLQEWLGSARAACPRAGVAHQPWQAEVISKPHTHQHMPETQPTAFTAALRRPETSSKHRPPSTWPCYSGPVSCCIARLQAAACWLRYLGGGECSASVHICRPKGSFPGNSLTKHKYLPASSAAGQLSGCSHFAH